MCENGNDICANDDEMLPTTLNCKDGQLSLVNFDTYLSLAF
jgi:hypothetical protein